MEVVIEDEEGVSNAVYHSTPLTCFGHPDLIPMCREPAQLYG